MYCKIIEEMIINSRVYTRVDLLRIDKSGVGVNGSAPVNLVSRTSPDDHIVQEGSPLFKLLRPVYSRTNYNSPYIQCFIKTTTSLMCPHDCPL